MGDAATTPTEGLLLYRDEPRGDGPPIIGFPDPCRVARAWSRLHGNVLMLFCGADIEAPVLIAGDHAYLPIVPTLDPPVYGSLANLIDDVPAISGWLAAWASSPTRKPCLTPDWATRRGVPPERVRTLATAISASVAASTTQQLRIASMCGRSATLVVPPGIQLTPHAQAAEPPQPALIRDVVAYHIGITPMGTLVRIREDWIGSSQQPGTTIDIPVAMVRRTVARMAQLARMLPTDSGHGR